MGGCPAQLLRSRSINSEALFRFESFKGHLTFRAVTGQENREAARDHGTFDITETDSPAGTTHEPITRRGESNGASPCKPLWLVWASA